MKKMKTYIGTMTVQAPDLRTARREFDRTVEHICGEDMNSYADTFNVRPAAPKIRKVWLDRNDDEFVLLLDDGTRNLDALLRKFNKQDNPQENPDWMGFTKFMEHNRVIVMDRVVDCDLEDFQEE